MPVAELLNIAAIAQDNFEFAFIAVSPFIIERTLNVFDIPTNTILSQDISGIKIE
jgi:flagellar assembly factor FliW